MKNSLKQEIFSRKKQNLLQKGQYYFVQYIKEFWVILRQLAICTMTSFYYYDQNPSGFCFLVQIGAFIIKTSQGFPNLNMKGKTKSILVVVLKWRHRTNGLFRIISDLQRLTKRSDHCRRCPKNPPNTNNSVFFGNSKY